MAEGKLKKIQEELNCPVCLDTYDNPKLLKCYHVYCKRCLTRLVREDEAGKRTISCPMCAKKTPVPETGVTDLEAAFQIIRFLDITGKEEGQTPKSRKSLCVVHQDKEKELYCKDCKELVCLACISSNGAHHSHNSCLLQEISQKFKEEITLLQTKLEKQLKGVEDTLQVHEKYRSEINKNQETLEKLVDLDGRKEIIMSQYHRVADLKIKGLEKEYNKFKVIKTQLSDCHNLLKSTIDIDDHLETTQSVLAKIQDLSSSFELDIISGLPENLSSSFSMKVLHCKVPFTFPEGRPPTFQNLKLFTFPVEYEIQTYRKAIFRLPTAFYFNVATGIVLTGEFVQQRVIPSLGFPANDSSLVRRNGHDSFRPPHGPPVHYLTSVGYGKEVGLPNGMHEIYDPCSKKKIILDHNIFEIVKDDRTRKPQKVSVQHTFIAIGAVADPRMLSDLCFHKDVIIDTAHRARSEFKPIGCTLSFCGQDGSQGTMGAPGMNGASSDFSIEHSYWGYPGNPGFQGDCGNSGQNGGEACLTLSGSAEQLIVTGQKEHYAFLGGLDSEQILLIDCHGGSGGRGGNGGKGGDGGNKKSNMPPKMYSMGSGGEGGIGGDGGNGGNAGNGGKCLIKTADSKLLMLVEVDCMPGEPGHGGKGGTGGLGGKGGVTTDDDIGKIPGTQGRFGASGRDGQLGATGKVGGILWVVEPDNSGPGEQSSSRYDLKVIDIKISSALNIGGIVEPNERIAVSKLVVQNIGGLELPGGALVSLHSSDGIKFEPSQYEIPPNVLPPYQTFTIPFKFFGRVNDQAPPNQPGLRTFMAYLRSRIVLLGRPFEHSVVKESFKVQYPIQISHIRRPTVMDCGEVAVFSIELKNLSDLPYGSCRSSVGRVVLHLHFDSRLIPLGPVNSDVDLPYLISYNHTQSDSTVIEILEIPPSKTIAVNIELLMEQKAEYYDLCYWQTDLLLRDKLIQYEQDNIKVTPIYEPRPSSDALFISSKFMTHKEFQFWHRIFDLLGITFDIWDMTRYCGLSIDTRTGKQHSNTWCGKYTGKMIVFPHCYDLQLLAGRDIGQHFHSESLHERTLQELQSSLVLFMPQVRNEAAVLKHLASVYPPVPLPTGKYGGKLSSKHNVKHVPVYISCEENILKEMEDSNISQAAVVLARQVRLTLAPDYTMYSYGSVDIRLLPILKSSKFLVLDGIGDFEGAEVTLDDDVIPLAKKYGQAVLAALYGLPIRAKLNLIKKTSSITQIPFSVTFSFAKSVMSIQELAMITLAREVADELFSLSTYRMQMLYDDIKKNSTEYVSCGRVILRGLKLIEEEIKHRLSAGLKKQHTRQTYNNIERMIKDIKRLLDQSGVKKTRLEEMRTLDQMKDLSRFHFCHQHFVKDNKWNLVDI